MGWRILLILCEPMLKLTTHYGFHDWFRFWHVYHYKYGSTLRWERQQPISTFAGKFTHNLYGVSWLFYPRRRLLINVWFYLKCVYQLSQERERSCVCVGGIVFASCVDDCSVGSSNFSNNVVFCFVFRVITNKSNYINLLL